MAEGLPRERSCAKKGLAQVRCLRTFAFSEAHSAINCAVALGRVLA